MPQGRLIVGMSCCEAEESLGVVTGARLAGVGDASPRDDKLVP
jgi:hypothetical protein